MEIDWADVLVPAGCSFVFGNPPFGGAKYQSEKQRAQVRRIAQLGGSGGTLDYVAAWFLEAGAYVRQSRAWIGFVATNAINQGEQVAQLWPLLFHEYGLVEIAFAHRTFAWGLLGVNTRLNEEQRQSWTISSFFLRVPRRVSEWLPQCGQASGCLAVSGTRAIRGIGDIREGKASPYHASRIVEKEHPHIGRGLHADWSRCGSRILEAAG